MSFCDSEPFAVVSEVSSQSIGPDYTDITSARVADVDIQITKTLREHHPELCVTIVPQGNAPLLQFAAAGFASAELDTETETIFRWRGYVLPQRRGGSGQLGDALFFAKYHYQWAGQDYIVYLIGGGLNNVQYILKEPDTDQNEHPLSNCAASDALVRECAIAAVGTETDFIYVYDGYWSRSRALWEEVQKSSWDNVILDSKMKKSLKNVTKGFFNSKDAYEKYGVAWKRGIIFYGPPGNGKTISVKALMRELSKRKNPVPTLYVKSAPYTWQIGDVFEFARSFAPCMLVMEDVETIVTPETRSYFFNEVDGLENNDGILMVATTNYHLLLVDKLDPGISKRPSRFDRKFDFPLPSRDERIQYAEFWRKKLADSSPEIEFPEKLSAALADITKKFSFAYMQEAFVASLLMLARDDEDDDDDDDDEQKNDAKDEGNNLNESIKAKKEDPLEKNKLWHALKTNVKILREDLDPEGTAVSRLSLYDTPTSVSRAPPKNLPGRFGPPRDAETAATLRDKAWMNYLPQKPTEPKRSGTLPSYKSRGMPQESYHPQMSPASQIGTNVNKLSGGGLQLGAIVPSTAGRMKLGVPSSSKARVSLDMKPKEDNEPSSADLWRAGVGKDQEFAETAFEWRPS